MTKKHFILMAAALKKAFLNADLDERRGFGRAIDALCEVFEADNKNFDEQRFRNACFPTLNERIEWDSRNYINND